MPDAKPAKNQNTRAILRRCGVVLAALWLAAVVNTLVPAQGQKPEDRVQKTEVPATSPQPAPTATPDLRPQHRPRSRHPSRPRHP